MHYYTRNLGDYAKDTAHLTTLQHGIYCRLMDTYYATEEPIPAAKAHRIAAADKGEVDLVLSDFFELSEDGAVWRHKRIDAEIEKYHEKAEKNRRNGQAGGRPRKENHDGFQKNHDAPQKKATGNLNQEPITNNQDKSPLNPPEGDSGRKRKPKAEAIELSTFLEALNGQKVFPSDDPLFEYAREIGLDASLVKLAWLEFRDLMVSGKKRQKDWRATFRTYIRKGYLKLWWRDEANEAWELTTAGKQAWMKHKGEVQ